MSSVRDIGGSRNGGWGKKQHRQECPCHAHLCPNNHNEIRNLRVHRHTPLRQNRKSGTRQVGSQALFPRYYWLWPI
jgi:hypothetical protein